MSTATKVLEKIFRDALDECAPERLVFNMIEPREGDKGFAVPARRFDVKTAKGKLRLFGAGKAAARMAKGVVAKLGEQISSGLLILPEGVPASDLGMAADRISILRGTHPDPSEMSVAATRTLIEAARACESDEHVIFVLSGGASSLLVQPVAGLTIAQKAATVRSAMNAGTPIADLNRIRCRLSEVKGGKLASHFRCGVTVLVLSDVVGNSFETIGSGPLFCADEDQSLIRHVLVGCGLDIARCAAKAARRAGFEHVSVDKLAIEGEVNELAEAYARRIDAGTKRTELIVRYGEPVVRIPPDRAARGLRVGGRSEQLALLLAGICANIPHWSFLAAGTDGCDGSSSAAGAAVDGDTWRQIQSFGFDPSRNLLEFNAHLALQPVGGLIDTGPTGNNLQDLHLLMLGGL